MEQERLYEELLSDVKRNGKLYLRQRKQLWKSFEDKTSLADLSPKEKEIKLALKAITKVASTLKEDDVFLSKIRVGIEHINVIMGASDEVKNMVDELYELVRNEMNEEQDFYIGYMAQIFKSFSMMFEDEENESETDNKDVPEDEEMEIGELDTSYCACVLWTYQDQSTSEKVRKKREQEFWKWYVKEAALIQGVTMKEDDDGDEQTDDEPEISIGNIEDFVKYVSYELDYLGKYEKRDEAKEIRIYVYNQKNGNCCPTCGKFSGHISTNFNGIMRFGKIKGWQIIFNMRENVCICDNPDCPEHEFMPTEEVDYKAKMANYKYIKSIPGNEKKLCELLGIL